jgi:EpsI family protein
MTYYYGRSAAEGTLHEVSGLLVYVAAVGSLICFDNLLRKLYRRRASLQDSYTEPRPTPRKTLRGAAPLLAALIIGGISINWLNVRPEPQIARRPLAEFPGVLGDWRQKGSEFQFDEQIEGILRTTDYTMREYTSPEGRVANIYVGYYASQRTGATYHSPQNCLPGAGWVLTDHQYQQIARSDGRIFTANRYLISNGVYTEILLYWYQGRGRVEASEYRDKMNTVWDSVTRQRSDGALVRVMTNVGGDEAAAERAAADLAARVSDELSPFVPE